MTLTIQDEINNQKERERATRLLKQVLADPNENETVKAEAKAALDVVERGRQESAVKKARAALSNKASPVQARIAAIRSLRRVLQTPSP